MRRFPMVRSFLAAFPPAFLPAAAAAAVLAGHASAQTLRSSLVQAGFTQPLYVTSPPGDTHRLFVVEHAGIIKIIKDGSLLATPFLNIDPIVGGGQAQSDERGLLGLAFHPGYAANRKFYVSYTDLSGSSVVREYLASAADPDVADTSTFTTVVGPILQPQSNHNGGCIQFGPDGKLYMSVGDGGAANDSGTGHDPTLGNGQSLATYLGKILRVDVDNPPTYVAAGNPFVGGSFPHIWAYGLRNTWRFSFDRLTGDLWLGDVGQNAKEEIDFTPASSTGGENYGWKCMEGFNCSGLGGCPAGGCADPSLRPPVREYNHGLGCSVTGGYVYRGSAIAGFQGHYIHADYCSGAIWSFTYNGSVQNLVTRTNELNPPGTLAINQVTSFGEDANGELYICDFGGGEVYKIEGQCVSPTIFCTTSPNSVGPGALMSFFGDGTLSQNNLLLGVTGGPPNKNGFFYYGSQTASVPAFNGIRCVGGTIHRLPVVQTNLFGDADWTFDALAPTSGITPGSTWHFQFHYRDTGTGTGLNYSDGLTVPFCP